MTTPFGDGIMARTRPGEGAPVLWFHGYTMTSAVWEELWDLLPGIPHIGIDLPGHGASRELEPGENLDSLAEVVGALAVEHGVRHLVAMSFGTLLALQVAVRRPDAFESIVLSAPGLAGGPTDPGVELRYEILSLLYSRFGPGPHMTQSWMRTPPDLFLGVRARPRLHERLAAIIDGHSWAELAEAGMLGLTSGRQDAATIAPITAASHIILGEHELPAFRQSAAIIQDALPGCVVHSVPETGHLALLEEPAVVAPIILDALRSWTSSPAH